MMKIFVSPYLIAIVILCVLNSLQYLYMSRKGSKGKYLALISLLVLFGLILLSTSVISSALSASLDISEAYHDPCPIDTVEVLSGGYYRGDMPNENTLGGETMARVIKGVEIFKKCNARTIIMSGWTPDSQKEVEVGLMRDLAITMGVPEDKVVVESDSRNTREHAIYLSRNKNITMADKIAIVTSPYHLKRAITEFYRYFNNVKPVAAYDSRPSVKLSVGSVLPQVGALSESVTTINEYIGMLWYRFLNEIQEK